MKRPNCMVAVVPPPPVVPCEMSAFGEVKHLCCVLGRLIHVYLTLRNATCEVFTCETRGLDSQSILLFV